MTEEPNELPEFDETVGEGPIDGLPPGDDARDLMRQRAMHGLLRSMHTADPESASARVDRVLAEVARGGKVLSIRRASAIAAGLLVAGYAIVRFALPGALPAPKQLLALASTRMQEDVDRLFDLDVSAGAVGGELTPKGYHLLFVRPGHHFVLQCRGGDIGTADIVCDGTTLWYMSRTDPADRLEAPWTESNAIRDKLAGFAILDMGYLDIEEFVGRIPGAEQDLQTVGREPGRRSDEPLVRITAERLMNVLGAGYRNIELLVGENSGMISRVEFDLVLGRLRTHLVLRYLADLKRDDTRYTRPW